MARFNSRLLFGFHGCDRQTGERLLGGADFHPSDNDYDWLGDGIYFWENDPRRAFEFARDIKGVADPFVVGAIIDCGECLDLSTRFGVESIRVAYEHLAGQCEAAGVPLPANTGPPPTRVLRRLDRAVLDDYHAIRAGDPSLPPIDVVRSPFIEGDEAYPGAGFRLLNHIQICVRNPDCIMGVFRLRDDEFST